MMLLSVLRLLTLSHYDVIFSSVFGCFVLHLDIQQNMESTWRLFFLRWISSLRTSMFFFYSIITIYIKEKGRIGAFFPPKYLSIIPKYLKRMDEKKETFLYILNTLN